MGATSSSLRPEEIASLQAGTHFNSKEIKRLYKRFKKLDRDGSGTITSDEFLMIPELAVNPLRQRVIAIFDTDKDESVNFKEFISALSVFSAKGEKQAKLEFAFKVYDLDGDGFITNYELFTVLKMMVGNNLSDVQLQQIVDKTIAEADEDKDGRISFTEFAKVLSHNDLDSKMTIRF
jgi:serine/threonine-protein phosphatase 2B regulatory subunit